MFEEFLTRKNSWAGQEGSSSEVVFSSRLRLARNLTDFAFPLCLSDSLAQELLNRVRGFIDSKKEFSFVELSELSELDKNFLLERHLVSRQFLAAKKGGLAFSSESDALVMVNEEDHFRLQVLEPGCGLMRGWYILSSLDDAFSQNFQYAFQPDLGHLTSCLTNAGTGLRASCMLHLPGLVLTEKIKEVLDFLTKLSLNVRGFFGEGSQALGHFFQISNRVSLGVEESEVIDNLENIVEQIRRHELSARRLLLSKFKVKTEDIVWRALGIMRNSRLIDCQEALEHLSILFLGTDLGIIKEIRKKVVADLFLTIQPAHLQKIEGKALNQRERDYFRAELLREKLR